MSNNTHVTDICGFIHKTTDLVCNNINMLGVSRDTVGKNLILVLTYCEVTVWHRKHRAGHLNTREETYTMMTV